MLGRVAQSVEQRTENPCVRSSILRPATEGGYVLGHRSLAASNNLICHPSFLPVMHSYALWCQVFLRCSSGLSKRLMRMDRKTIQHLGIPLNLSNFFYIFVE